MVDGTFPADDIFDRNIDQLDVRETPRYVFPL